VRGADDDGRQREFVRISVTDSGVGMPPDVQARAFEPFFTTKPGGEGTGLGLPLTRTIVDLHHGSLELDFPERGGTVATIWLPLARDLVLAPAPAVVAAPAASAVAADPSDPTAHAAEAAGA
jgi:signal transduction histidine kinase